VPKLCAVAAADAEFIYTLDCDTMDAGGRPMITATTARGKKPVYLPEIVAK